MSGSTDVVRKNFYVELCYLFSSPAYQYGRDKLVNGDSTKKCGWLRICDDFYTSEIVLIIKSKECRERLL